MWKLLWPWCLLCRAWGLGLALGLAAAAAHAAAPGPLRLDEARGSVPLAGQMAWLADPGGQATLAEVRASGAWQRLPGKPDFGFTPSTIWLRLTVLQPAQAPAEWVLSVDGTQVDEVQLHGAEGASAPPQRAGRLVAHARWPMDSRTPAFRLRLPPGEHQLYLRMRSEHTLSNDVSLRTADAFRVAERQQALLFGALFGVQGVALALLLLFGPALWQTLRAWYLLYTLALAFMAMVASGYLQSLLITEVPVPTLWLALNLCLAWWILTRMSAVWLDLDQLLPRFSRWYQRVVGAMALGAMALTVIEGGRIGVQVVQWAFVLTSSLAFGLSLYLWRRGSAQAGPYLLIFGLLEAGVTARFARNTGALPINFFTDHAVFIGMSIHLVAMSVYFIVRFRNMAQALHIEQQARTEQREFVGMVSHEFKTPLAIIHTSIQQLSANLDAPHEKNQQRADNIRNAVRRMDRLLDEYLSVERLDAAHQPLRREATDFFEVIEEAVSDWPLEQVRLQVDELPEPVVCDPDMMRIVLRNLLENAVRHSPAGRAVALTVRRAADNALRITVADQGEGIPAEELPRLFQKFFRGKAAQGSPGAGLGLYLVERIVRAHQGRITVDSVVGQGTRFTVELPGRA